MASKRPKTRSTTSQTLVSAIGARKDLKPSILKRLYGLLVHLSLNKLIPSSEDEDQPNRFDPGVYLGGLVMRSGDRHSVGELLFRELDFRFGLLFSALSDASASGEKARALLRSDLPARVEGLTLLLRCCMVLLTLADHDVVLEKTRLLLGILGRLIAFVTRGNKNGSVTFEKLVSRESSYNDDACTGSVSEDFVVLLSILEPSHVCHPLLCAVLEVFADELLLHRLLREYFMRVDSASCTSKSLVGCHFLSGDIGIVLEAISVHFILSLSDKEAFENFIDRLSCRAGKNLGVSELSLTAALSLLLNPLILSAPKILQAHLILLVSEAIGGSMSSDNIGLNMRLMGTYYLTAFERSVILYTGFMSTFLIDDHPIGRKASHSTPGLFDRSSEPSFECHIQETTRAKIDDIAVKSDSLWNLERCSVFDKAKPHILVDLMVFMSESQVEESCKDDIFSILNSIVLGAFSDSFISDIVLHEKAQTSPQHIYLLAAILKLMSSSMSAVIWCLKHDANVVCSNNAEAASPRTEYDSIVSIIGCFRHFNVSLPNQKKLFGEMETHLIRHKTTKWMLLHFSGLLSLSFTSGFDFLVENCISTMVTLMNLYVFEEGTIGALMSSLVSDSESFSPPALPHELGEDQADQRLCKKIASRIQKIQTMYLSSESRSEDSGAETSRNACVMRFKRDSTTEIEETEETCNGKVFLDCILEGSSKTSDLDDLADFIKCKPGKDYSSWLKDKETHRKWRSEKMAVLRWKKRKKTWKLMANINKP